MDPISIVGPFFSIASLLLPNLNQDRPRPLYKLDHCSLDVFDLVISNNMKDDHTSGPSHINIPSYKKIAGVRKSSELRAKLKTVSKEPQVRDSIRVLVHELDGEDAVYVARQYNYKDRVLESVTGFRGLSSQWGDENPDRRSRLVGFDFVDHQNIARPEATLDTQPLREPRGLFRYGPDGQNETWVKYTRDILLAEGPGGQRIGTQPLLTYVKDSRRLTNIPKCLLIAELLLLTKSSEL
jgi:hypothetical protein